MSEIALFSYEAEWHVVGGLLVNNDAIDKVLGLNVADFYDPFYRQVYGAILELLKQNKPADVVTISAYMEERYGIFVVQKLVEIVNNTISAANIGHHARIVMERAGQRQFMAVVEQLQELAQTGGELTEKYNQAEKLLFQLTERSVKKSAVRVGEALPSVMEKIEAAYASGNSITGVESGFNALDNLLHGLQPTDLIVLAARPSMGKTAFSLNVAEFIAARADIDARRPVVVYSLEMPTEKLIHRFLSSIGRVDGGNIQSGQLEDDDWDGLGVSLQRLANAPLFINDSSDITPLEMRAELRRITRQEGPIGLIVVDYLQKMRLPGYAPGDMRLMVGEISRSLKAIAKEFKAPVIALSQLSRKCEERTNKRPVSSDLRESGDVEQDADVIMCIYRDEVYNPDSRDKGTAEILIRKNRNGPIGGVRLDFAGNLTKFENHNGQSTISEEGATHPPMKTKGFKRGRPTEQPDN